MAEEPQDAFAILQSSSVYLYEQNVKNGVCLVPR